MPNPQPGQEQMMELCEECGLPIVECNAVAMARKETERWLRDEGYGGIDARKRAAELVPSTRPAADPGEYGELAKLMERMGLARDMLSGHLMPDAANAVSAGIDRLGTQAADIARLREGLRQIELGAINGEAEFRRRLGTKSHLTWYAVNSLQDYLTASGGTAGSLLSPNPTSP